MPEDINGSIAMIVHHVSHFLLCSRVRGVYYNGDEINKAFLHIKELESLLPNKHEQINEFWNKICSLKIGEEIDRQLLDNIQQSLNSNICSL